MANLRDAVDAMTQRKKSLVEAGQLEALVGFITEGDVEKANAQADEAVSLGAVGFDLDMRELYDLAIENAEEALRLAVFVRALVPEEARHDHDVYATMSCWIDGVLVGLMLADLRAHEQGQEAA